MFWNFRFKANELWLWRLFGFRFDTVPCSGVTAIFSYPASQEIGVYAICKCNTGRGNARRSAGFNQLALKIVGVSTAFLDRRPFNV